MFSFWTPPKEIDRFLGFFVYIFGIYSVYLVYSIFARTKKKPQAVFIHLSDKGGRFVSFFKQLLYSKQFIWQNMKIFVQILC